MPLHAVTVYITTLYPKLQHRLPFCLPLLLLLIFSCSSPEAKFNHTLASVPDKIDFNFHVRPILSDRCYKCHGPDENARKADLRLDISEGAFALLDSAENRYALVPGNVHQSHVYKRVASQNPDYKMPPPDSKLSLSENEIEILKRWIEQGAEWKQHWAFIPPVPQVVPKVSKSDWPINPIDHFILDRIQHAGLAPAAEASKEKLIRRLSFDLRGIPPDLEEIHTFLADDTPEAYEKLVDRFLADKDYGERLALEWLDLARYADSHGYQDDLERTMWPWRDWVIGAFNKNLPYDQFVTWQLAGDLLPDASYDQILATGFNRNHKITQEVGVVEEEYRVEYVLDRVNTFATSFLGLTVGCAQCHDHKFDPISQKEFYSLFSFFNNVPEEGRVDYGMKIAEPSLPIPDTTVVKYTDYMKKLVGKQEQQLVDYEMLQWAQRGDIRQLPDQSGPTGAGVIPRGLVAYYPFDYINQGSTPNQLDPSKPAVVVNGVVPRQGKYSGGLDFSGENHLELGVVKGLSLRGPVTISFWFYTVENGARGTIIAPKSTSEGRKSGFELNTYDDGIRFVLNQYTNPKQKGGAIAVQTSHILPGNQWAHITFTYNGSNKASGIKLYMNGKEVDLVVLGDDLAALPALSNSIMVGKTALRDGFRANPQGLFRARLDELMFFNRVLTSNEVQALAQYDPFKELLQRQNPDENTQKRLFYQQLHAKDPVYQQMTRWLSEYKYREMRTQHLVLKSTMVMAEMDTARDTYILERGLYSAPTEMVYPATPKQVMTFSEGFPKNRLGLAQWLFDPEHPLTARVAVNRYWQMIFGRGIVSTTEDFGSQGNLPTHPELLDWLALDFSSDWDLKRLLKVMVMSATYRQSVASNGSKQLKDPQNILLARGPQTRLQAELVRDHALAVSGLLSEVVGGPSVNPYQPKGLWLQVASGNQELKEYIQGHGQDLYRKSIYTFWKRSLPPPSMIIFDAATREQCAVKRQSTSTPMQALLLLNDPQFTETSRLLAQRMILEGGDNERDRIRLAFQLATSRLPSDKELGLLIDLYRDQHSVFASNPDRAGSLLQVGEYGYDPELDVVELATYTVVANAILNLTETILKG